MNIQDFIHPRNQSQQDMREEWLSHLTYANPVGVNRVLSRYGYQGHLQPNNRDETIEALEMLVEQNGSDAISDLMRILPEFDAIRELLTPRAKPILRVPKTVEERPVMMNATGSEIIAGLTADEILKGAIIFGIVYLLINKL